MAIHLHTLRPAHGSTKRVRRVGRGHGSGRGKTSGRGTKGQRARSGGTKGLKRLGLRRMILSIPKKRGFHRASLPIHELRWDDINAVAESQQRITREFFIKQGLLRSSEIPKIINTGTLRHEGLTMVDIAMTKGARAHLLSKGGKEIRNAKRES